MDDEQTNDDRISDGTAAEDTAGLIYSAIVSSEKFERNEDAAKSLEKYLSMQPYRTLDSVPMLQYRVSEDKKEEFESILESAVEDGIIESYHLLSGEFQKSYRQRFGSEE